MFGWRMKDARESSYQTNIIPITDWQISTTTHFFVLFLYGRVVALAPHHHTIHVHACAVYPCRWCAPLSSTAQSVYWHARIHGRTVAHTQPHRQACPTVSVVWFGRICWRNSEKQTSNSLVQTAKLNRSFSASICVWSQTNAFNFLSAKSLFMNSHFHS